MLTAVNGFKKCEIFSYDTSVFSESDFAASLVTDIPQPESVPHSEIQTATTHEIQTDLIPSPQTKIEPANNPGLAVASTLTAPSMI